MRNGESGEMEGAQLVVSGESWMERLKFAFERWMREMQSFVEGGVDGAFIVSEVTFTQSEIRRDGQCIMLVMEYRLASSGIHSSRVLSLLLALNTTTLIFSNITAPSETNFTFTLPSDSFSSFIASRGECAQTEYITLNKALNVESEESSYSSSTIYLNSITHPSSDTLSCESIEHPCYSLSYGATHLSREGDLSIIIDSTALIGGAVELNTTFTNCAFTEITLAPPVLSIRSLKI